MTQKRKPAPARLSDGELVALSLRAMHADVCNLLAALCIASGVDRRLDWSFDEEVSRELSIRNRVRKGAAEKWTGPLAEDLDDGGNLKRTVTGSRWPFGPPPAHEGCCALFSMKTYCDCKASDASDIENGVGA